MKYMSDLSVSVSEGSLALLRAEESTATVRTEEPAESRGLRWATTALMMLGATAVFANPIIRKSDTIDYRFDITSGACSQVSQITAVNEQRTYVAKTALGKRLVALREKAIARGLRLLTEEEIREEIMLRRGESV